MKRIEIIFRNGALAVMAVLFLTLVGCGGSDESANESTGIKVVNNAPASIYHLYVSPTSTSNWGPDQLGTSTVPANGGSVAFTANPGRYDLKLIMSTGNQYTLYNFEVTAGQTITVINPSYNYKQVTATEAINVDEKIIGTEKNLTIKYVMPEQGQGALK